MGFGKGGEAKFFARRSAGCPCPSAGGPAGPAGPAGATGPAGPTGPTGPGIWFDNFTFGLSFPTWGKTTFQPVLFVRLLL